MLHSVSCANRAWWTAHPRLSMVVLVSELAPPPPGAKRVPLISTPPVTVLRDALGWSLDSRAKVYGRVMLEQSISVPQGITWTS